MADQISTFIQATGKTLSELNAGVPIVVNTAGQTAVIKEVEIQTTGVPVGTEFYLDSSGWQLGDTLTTESAGTAVDLTYQEGFEYIGESQTYSLKTDAQAVFNGYQSAYGSYIKTSSITPNSNGTGGTAFSSQYIRTGAGSNEFTIGAQTLVNDSGAAFTATPTLYFYHDGDFYYAMEGAGSLFKRAGGVGGTQTTITGHGTHCWAYDGGRYVFTMTNSTQNYSQYDLQTSSFVRQAVTISIGANVVQGYCGGAALDGFYYPRGSWSSGVYVVDPTDNSTHSLSLGNSSYEKTMFGVAKHTNGDYIVASRGYAATTPFYFKNIGPNPATPTSTIASVAGALTSFTPVMPSTQSSNNWRAIPYNSFYTVTVVNSGSGNKFAIDGVEQETLYLYEGATYKFDQSDSTNAGHPLRFSTTANGTHGGGSEYTTGVTTNGTAGSAGAYTQIVVATGAATLYYYCSAHSGMGGTANTPVRQNQFLVMGGNSLAWIVDFTDVVSGYNGKTSSTAIQYFKTNNDVTSNGWQNYCIYGQPINITNANSAFGTVAIRSTGVKTT